jgi:hypothetical protein
MRFLSVMVVVGCVLVGVVVRPGHAGAFHNFFGLSKPGQTLTFNEVALPTDTVVTDQYAGLGVTFSPLVYYSPQTGFPGIVGHDIGNVTFSGNLVDPTTSSHFSQPLTDAAFAIAADITKYTFTALLSGSPVAGGAGSAQHSAFRRRYARRGPP